MTEKEIVLQCQRTDINLRLVQIKIVRSYMTAQMNGGFQSVSFLLYDGSHFDLFFNIIPVHTE